MTVIRNTNAAEKWEPDGSGALRTGAPAGPANDPLPPLEARPGLIRPARSRPAIPGFDGEFEEPIDIAPADIADLVREAEEVAGRDGRAWPDIQPAPRQCTDEPESRNDNSRHEIAALRAEIAELKEIRDKQNAALERARETLTQREKETALARKAQRRADEAGSANEDSQRERTALLAEIAGLKELRNEQNAALERARETLTQQEQETSLARQALRRADEEKAALQAKLEKLNANFAELLRQTAALNADFDEREKAIAAAEARVATLKAQLSEQTSGDTDLAAAIEEAKTRYYRDFTRRCAGFEGELARLAQTVGARDERIRKQEDDNERLAARCDALARKAHDLDAEKRAALERLASQTATASFLDSTLRAERDAAERKIAQLAADLERERLERATDAHEAALVCKEIVGLLPRLAQRSSRSLESLEQTVRRAGGTGREP